jgi:hypothetical protein
MNHPLMDYEAETVLRHHDKLPRRAQHLAGADAAQRAELVHDVMIGGDERRRRSARSR